MEDIFSTTLNHNFYKTLKLQNGDCDVKISRKIKIFTDEIKI